MGCILDIVANIIKNEFERLYYERELLEQIINGDSTYVCAVCGKKIEKVAYQRKTRDVLWCGKEHYYYKPRKIIHLERIFGKKIEDVLKDVTYLCSDIKTQCRVLGVSIPYLYNIIRKYGGIDFLEFMQKYSSDKRKELYERFK